jgi:hypothetical protein
VRSRVPFDFALMDRRHRPFVEGRRDGFLTPLQLIGEQKRLKIGYPVPGEVIKAQWVPLVKSPKDPKLDIEYMFSTPGRHNFRAQWQILASDRG